MIKKIIVNTVILCNILHAVTLPSLPDAPTKIETAAIKALKAYETAPAGMPAMLAQKQTKATLEDLVEGPFATEAIKAFEALQIEKGVLKNLLLHPTPKQEPIKLLYHLTESLFILNSAPQPVEVDVDVAPTPEAEKPIAKDSPFFQTQIKIITLLEDKKKRTEIEDLLHKELTINKSKYTKAEVSKLQKLKEAASTDITFGAFKHRYAIGDLCNDSEWKKACETVEETW